MNGHTKSKLKRVKPAQPAGKAESFAGGNEFGELGEDSWLGQTVAWGFGFSYVCYTL